MTPTSPPAYEFLSSVERSYAALIAHAAPAPQAEPDLGGRLLYVADLNPDSCALIVAANIAGAATVAASGDAALQRQANRDGVLDFQVTSLDEALRILKNEVRKRQPVAVCVDLAPEVVEAEMRERGVLPDLYAPASTPDPEVLLCWSVASSPARWLPRLDALAADCLAAEALAARRWLRLAPRYLGRTAQNTHLLRCSEDAAAQFVQAVEKQTASGEIGISVEIQMEAQGGRQVFTFQPAERTD